MPHDQVVEFTNPNFAAKDQMVVSGNNEAVQLVLPEASKQAPFGDSASPPFGYVKRGPWRPYEDCPKEMPLWRWFCRFYYQCRYPLTRVFRYSLFRFDKFEITVGGILVFLIVFTLMALYSGLGYKRASFGDLAKSTGSATAVSLILLFSVSGRNSIWGHLFGVPYERIAIWHKLLSMAVVGQGAFHAWVVYDNRFNESVNDKRRTGWVLFGFLAAMLVLSPLVAYGLRLYRTFWVFHRLLAIGVVIIATWHHVYIAWVGFGLWIVDVLLRSVWLLVNRSKVKTVTARRVSDKITELRCPRNGFTNAGGQYAFITLPQVSFWEPHPFSISAAPHQKDITFHVRSLGDWTTELFNSVEVPKELSIYMDGPYGSPSLDFDNPSKSFFVFVSGGIGVTPNIAYANTLLDQVVRGRQIKKLVFVWAVRNLQEVYALISADDLLFRYRQNVAYLSKLAGRELDPQMVEIEVYVTQAGTFETEVAPPAAGRRATRLPETHAEDDPGGRVSAGRAVAGQSGKPSGERPRLRPRVAAGGRQSSGEELPLRPQH